MLVPLTRSCLAPASDEELLDRSHQGDRAAVEQLLHRYRHFVRARARRYFLVGGDSDDIEQEGMIGLYKSIRDFRHDREASFASFADLCVTRQIHSALKASTRIKHQPLARYVSISGPALGRAGAEEHLEGRSADDPADRLVAAERLQELQRSIARILSPFELQVLGQYVEGYSYAEIGHQLGRSAKAIDNAVQRVRRKVSPHLSAHEDADRAA